MVIVAPRSDRNTIYAVGVRRRRVITDPCAYLICCADLYLGGEGHSLKHFLVTQMLVNDEE